MVGRGFRNPNFASIVIYSLTAAHLNSAVRVVLVLGVLGGVMVMGCVLV